MTDVPFFPPLPPVDSIREVQDAEFYAEWLRRRIETLTEEPLLWSRSAYTPNRSIHRIFRNGNNTEQCQRVDSIAFDSIPTCAEKTFEAVRAYAEAIGEKRVLIWRCEPQITRREPDKDGWDIYVRLSFEAPSDVAAR